MSFSALIIRADGALAETEALRYACFAHVFSEAGYEWCWDKASFSEVPVRGNLHQRMAYFVHSRLRGRPATDDLSALVSAMHRRACNLFSEMIAASSIEPRPGIKDVILAAREDGIRVVIASALSKSDTDLLIAACIGETLRRDIDVVVVDDATEPAPANTTHSAIYSALLQCITVDPARGLVIEATLSGRDAARQAGYSVLTTRSAFCHDCSDLGAADGVFDDVRSLLSVSKDRRFDPMTSDERGDLLAVLQRLHAGHSVSIPGSARSITMRVSDILGSKGSVVKTIQPTMTIRSFADALKQAGVGAMVVQDTTGRVNGIISERDLARGVADYGGDVQSMSVAELMTPRVITCTPDDSVASVAKIMTERRIRHVPVVVNGALVGLISIGDVLKYRLDEVQLEANILRDYAIARK